MNTLSGQGLIGNQICLTHRKTDIFLMDKKLSLVSKTVVGKATVDFRLSCILSTKAFLGPNSSEKMLR